MKIIGILFALVLAASLVLVPAAVFAQDECKSGCDNDDVYEGLHNCEWDNVKWHSNENSWHLYLSRKAAISITNVWIFISQSFSITILFVMFICSLTFKTSTSGSKNTPGLFP